MARRKPAPAPAPPDLPREPNAVKAVFASDFHVPYQDRAAVRVWLAFLRWFRPDEVFLVGDVMDCYSVSAHLRDPRRRLSLQAEIDETRELLGGVRAACPAAKITYLGGNHEYRLPRYLCGAPELAELKDLQLPALLRLSGLDIAWADYQSGPLTWHGLLVEHGDRSRGTSAATARAMLEARGASGVSGHTHRMGSYYRTDHGGVHVWHELGCLCEIRAEYVIGRPNWQNGFAVGYALGGHTRFHIEPVPVINGRILFAGRVWE